MKRLLSTTCHAALIGAALLATPTAMAKIEEAEDRLIYTLPYFEQYSPTTAMDMVNQIPGFQLQGESQDRGFSQGKGNLLINGKRPSTKGVDARTLLGRIPATSVERIELLKEGSAELAGQTGLIVNVIVKNDDRLGGSWQLGGRYEERGRLFPTGRVSVTGNSGKFRYSVGLELTRHARVRVGPEYIYDADRELTELRDEKNTFAAPNWALTTTVGYDADNGSVLNLNFKGERWKSYSKEFSDRYTPNADGGFGDLFEASLYDQEESEYNYEVGGDYTFNVVGGNLKFIALRRMEDSKFDTEYTESPVDGVDYLYRSKSNPIETENIIRSVYSFSPVDGHNFEWAIEGVENGLDTSASYEEDLNDGNGLQPIIVDGSDRIVTEKRGESSLLYTRDFGSKLSFQSTAAVEYSKITVTGQEDQARSYWRPKGFVSLTYNLAPKTNLRARFERKVGQLNFFVFASSVNVTEGTTDASNTKLVPDQTWHSAMELTHRFGERNIVSLEAFYDYIDDFITKIPFGDGTEGDGNINSAKKWGAKFNITYMTDDVIPGGRITFYTRWWDSSLIDPLTGEKRGHDNFQCCGASFRFRQDVPDTFWNWGFQVNHGAGRKFHRIDQITKTSNSAPDYYNAFVGHNNIFGMKGEVRISMPFGRTTTQRRTFFSPDRLGDFAGYEERFRKTGFDIRFNLTGTF